MEDSNDAFYGFCYNQRFYVVLSQDGKPSELGVRLVDEIVKMLKDKKKMEQWILKLRESKIVFEESIPTKEDIQKFKNIITEQHDKTNWTFLDDYYSYYKSLDKILSLGVILNSISPQGHPLVAPYGYVLNFDEKRFDIYIEHTRIDSLEDKYGTQVPILKEKIDLTDLNRQSFQRIVDKFERGIVSESSEGEEETDLEVSEGESDVE
jgi:hypothetical protein